MIEIGAALLRALSHHRTCGSASGGSSLPSKLAPNLLKTYQSLLPKIVHAERDMHCRALGHHPRSSSTTAVTDRLVARHPQLDQLLDPRPHAVPLFPVARSNATANPLVQAAAVSFANQSVALPSHVAGSLSDAAATGIVRSDGGMLS